jgi:hypothetical protein
MFLRGLLGSFPYRITGPAARSNRVGPLHFVPGKSQESLLISLVPIRERTALDVQIQYMIRLVDRIRTKVSEILIGSMMVCGSLEMDSYCQLRVPGSRMQTARLREISDEG